MITIIFWSGGIFRGGDYGGFGGYGGYGGRYEGDRIGWAGGVEGKGEGVCGFLLFSCSISPPAELLYSFCEFAEIQNYFFLSRLKGGIYSFLPQIFQGRYGWLGKESSPWTGPAFRFLGPDFVVVGMRVRGCVREVRMKIIPLLAVSAWRGYGGRYEGDRVGWAGGVEGKGVCLSTLGWLYLLYWRSNME